MTYLRSILIDPSNTSAFGTLETGELTPIIQGDFVYGLNTQLWNTANVTGTGAAVDTNASRLRIQAGTSSSGYAYITSRRLIRYRAGQGNVVRMTPVFSAGLANNTQLFGVGTLVSGSAISDGYFFGYNGTSFGIAHYNRGVPTWYPQTTWNTDPCLAGSGSFTYDPTKGTPLMIKYPYLGYGDIEFFLQVPTTGRWTLAHVIRYANTTNQVQVGNPGFQVIGFNGNSGNTTNQTMFVGSIGVFLSGMRSFAGNPRWAVDNNKASITTETNIVSIKNCLVYNGVPNRGAVRLNSVSCSNSANTTAFLRFKLNSTLGGTPSFIPVNGSTVDNGNTITNGNSIASIDTAGTTVTSGTYVFNLSLGPTSASIIDLTPYEIFISPGEVLTLSGGALANTTIGVSQNWSEDI